MHWASSLLGFVIFGIPSREEFGDRDAYDCVCVCVSPFVILFTGPEPDRQADLLERKHLISFLVRSLS